MNWYRWKVLLLKTLRGDLLWRRWRSRRGDAVGDYKHLPDLIRTHAPGRSFADIGCMWGVNGEYSFLAEASGATSVKAVDLFGPTPEFEARHRESGSSVEFVLGDISRPETLERVGVADVVLCAGVLYHHPSPFDLLVALRRICGGTLLLRTWAIPEVDGLPNAAVYFPGLDESGRRLWDLSKRGVEQVGIVGGFEAAAGYGNWFWGLTPSCLVSMLETAGFRVEERRPEAFAQTLICTPTQLSFEHRLPGEEEARQQGTRVSEEGRARPG